MIDEIQIYEGIKAKLINYFPSFIINSAQETNQNVFNIDFLNSKDEKVSGNLLRNASTFNIVYFPGDDYKNIIKVLKVKRKLLYIFLKPLQIIIKNKKNYLYIGGISFTFDKNNFILTMNFVIETSQVIPPQEEIINETEENETIDFDNLYDDENLNNDYMQKIISDTKMN